MHPSAASPRVESAQIVDVLPDAWFQTQPQAARKRAAQFESAISPGDNLGRRSNGYRSLATFGTPGVVGDQLGSMGCDDGDEKGEARCSRQNSRESDNRAMAAARASVGTRTRHCGGSVELGSLALRPDDQSIPAAERDDAARRRSTILGLCERVAGRPSGGVQLAPPRWDDLPVAVDRRANSRPRRLLRSMSA